MTNRETRTLLRALRSVTRVRLPRLTQHTRDLSWGFMCGLKEPAQNTDESGTLEGTGSTMAKIGEGDQRWIVKDRADGTNVNGWHWQVRAVRRRTLASARQRPSSGCRYAPTRPPD